MIERGSLHTSAQDFAEKYTKTDQIQLSYFGTLMCALSIVYAGLSLLCLLRRWRIRLIRISSQMLLVSRRKFQVLRSKIHFKC